MNVHATGAFLLSLTYIQMNNQNDQVSSLSSLQCEQVLGHWFTDGRCECVGHHCPAYSINESRYRGCSNNGVGNGDDDDDIAELSHEELAR